MAAEAKHRDAIVAAAANLFRQRGFTATGMNDIVAESGAPKGSVYHYFPGGKAQIGAAALALSGGVLRSRMQALAEAQPDPSAFLREFVAKAADALKKSGFRNGCPVAGVIIDTPPSDARTMQAADDALGLWRGLIGTVCIRAGMSPDRAAFVASVAVSAFEGALVQARAAGDIAPLADAGEALAMIVDTELRRTGSQIPV